MHAQDNKNVSMYYTETIEMTTCSINNWIESTCIKKNECVFAENKGTER